MSVAGKIDLVLSRLTPWGPALLSWLGGLMVALLPFLQHWLKWFPSPLDRTHLGPGLADHLGPRGFVYQALSQGRLPLWDPYRETGLPTLDYLPGLLNPLVFLQAVLFGDGQYGFGAIQIMVVLHISLGGLGAYIWGLSQGLGRCSALLMGVVWSAASAVLLRKEGQELIIHSLAWLPFIFMFLDMARQRASWLAAAWGGVFLGLLILCGHPQYIYMTIIFLALYLVYHLLIAWRQSGASAALIMLRRIWLPFALSAVICAAPVLGHHLGQALGTGFTPLSAPSDFDRLIQSQPGTGQLRMLLYLLLPTMEGGQVETYIYVGILPLIMAGLGLRYLSRAAAGYWKLVLLCSLVLMAGNAIGLHKFLLDLLPGYDWFTHSRRYLVFSHLALTVLAARYLHSLLAATEPPQLKSALAPLAVLCGILALALLFAFGAWHIQLPGVHPAGPSVLTGALSAALLLAGLTWLILSRLVKGQNRPGLRLLAAALIILDLVFYFLPVTAWERRDFHPDSSRLSQSELERAAGLVKLTGGKPVRIISDDGYLSLKAAYRHELRFMLRDLKEDRSRFGREYWDIRERIKQNPGFLDLLSVEYLQPHRPAAGGGRRDWSVVNYSQAAIELKRPDAVHSLSIQAHGKFLHGAKTGAALGWLGLLHEGKLTAQWPLRLGREVNGGKQSLALPAAVQASELLIASDHPQAGVWLQAIWLNGQRLVQGLKLEEAGLSLSRNTGALPLVYFVERAAPAHAYGEFLAALGSIDPSRCVLLSEKPRDFEAPRGISLSPGGRAGLVSWQPEKVVARVQAARSGYLVMSQTMAPGWEARIDGRPLPVLKAHGLISAVRVPAGGYTVTFEYREPLVWLGIWLALIWVLGLAAFGIWRLRLDKADD
jgi:hypothetical protein